MAAQTSARHRKPRSSSPRRRLPSTAARHRSITSKSAASPTRRARCKPIAAHRRFCALRTIPVRSMLERNPQTGGAESLSEAELLDLERQYCSHGDTVHYTEPPKLFERCEGSFLYDAEGREYLDLQMWYSAVNFGYRNRRLGGAMAAQLERLPQLARQYLHRGKNGDAAHIARRVED